MNNIHVAVDPSQAGAAPLQDGESHVQRQTDEGLLRKLFGHEFFQLPGRLSHVLQASVHSEEGTRLLSVLM